jgi:acyl carrier protein
MEATLREIVGRLFLHGDMNYPIRPDTELLQEGICDSLGLVELAVEIESRYAGLRILDQDVTPENLGSITRMVAFLRSRNIA